MLAVWLHGSHCGDLRARSGDWEFRVSPSFLDQGERPVLGRWFEDQNLATLLYKSSQGRLPPFFDNYLPQLGSGLRELLARKAGVDPTRHGPLLAALGEDLPGALLVRSVEDYAAVEDEAPQVDPAAPTAGALRFSLAGLQLKFSVLREGDRLTLPATGVGGRWILKLPDNSHPRLPEHEFAMLSLASDVGIDVPEHRTVAWRDVEGLPSELNLREPLALLVRRYDRADDGARVHQEDFAQVLNRSSDDRYDEYRTSTLGGGYHHLARVIRTVCSPHDFEEYVRRLTFMLLIGNGDAHLKNWSLYYPNRRKARLTPAYDLVATVAYQRDDQLALKLHKKRRFDDIRKGDFEHLARYAGHDESQTVRIVEETAERFRQCWSTRAPELPLSAEAVANIDSHLASLKL